MLAVPLPLLAWVLKLEVVMCKNYYVYGLFYEDENGNNICFYIGKGKNDRKDQHFDLKGDHNFQKQLLIKTLNRLGVEIYSKILVGELNNKTAMRLEARLLRKDIVYNETINKSRGVSLPYEPTTEENKYEMIDPVRAESLEWDSNKTELNKGVEREEESTQNENLAKNNNQNCRSDYEKLAAKVKWYNQNTGLSMSSMSDLFDISVSFIRRTIKENDYSKVEAERPSKPFSEAFYKVQS